MTMKSEKRGTAGAADHGFRLGLGFRLAMIFGLTVAALSGGMAFLMLNLQEENLFREAVHGAERFAETLRRTAHLSMMRNQRGDLQDIISQAATVEQIESVRIINKSGLVTYSSKAEEIGERVDMEADACVICHARGEALVAPKRTERVRIFKAADATRRIMGFITPIYNERSCGVSNCHAPVTSQKVLGVIDVQLSLAEIDGAAGEERRKVFTYIVAGAVLLALIAGISAYFLIAKPVRHMASVCRHISTLGEDQMNITITPSGAEELEELAIAFNAMTERIAHAHDTLEQKVEERTRQLRETENQLVRSEKLAALGVLAAGIAHEINNPLAGIITYAHLLLRKADPQGADAKRLKTIISEAERCNKIVGDLLTLAVPGENRSAPANLKQTLDSSIALVSVHPDFQNVVMTPRYGESSANAMIDKDAVQQVVLNILKNAVDAGARKIDITVERAGRFVELAIDDDGAGIPKENLSKIFDPFFTTKDVGKGTGLGLWICYRIVTELGGTIEAVQRDVGGTRFLIRFPTPADA